MRKYLALLWITGSPWITLWPTFNMCLAFYQKACCGGSLTCCNETCNFQKCYGKENLLQFNKSKNTCSVCRNPVEFIPDLAVNIWKFDDSARKMIVMMDRQGGEARKRDKEAMCTYRRSKQKTNCRCHCNKINKGYNSWLAEGRWTVFG